MASQIDKIIQEFQDTGSKRDRQKIGAFQGELARDRKLIDSVPEESKSKLYMLLRTYYMDKMENRLTEVKKHKNCSLSEIAKPF